jgi:hypothetical protein
LTRLTAFVKVAWFLLKTPTIKKYLLTRAVVLR